MEKATNLVLKFGLDFQHLYDREGLIRLDTIFLDHLASTDAPLAERLTAARDNPETVDKKQESELLIDLAPHLDDFVAALFGIEAEARALAERHDELAPLYSCKRLFIQRRALKGVKADDAAAIDGPALEAELVSLMGESFSELAFARAVNGWLDDEAANAAAIETAARYAAWATLAPAGQARHSSTILFHTPHKLDFQHLVPLETDSSSGYSCHRLPEDVLRYREGFKLTDHGTDLVGALDEANYCIFCHKQGKDSCSTGLREKKTSDDTPPPFRSSPLGVPLAGCPLEEKISEMHAVKIQGHSIATVAMITVDNPMCAGTGHRICNDCMKSCIYQRQDPVDIPQVETRGLKDVLALPWGFEIYSLLTRWNPLDIRRPLPKAPSGYRVLIVGMGPAGYTLAHHLMNDGHTVVGIDGLKIEPLPAELSGVEAHGERVPFRPIRDTKAIYEELNARVMAGFGGVAEYGITVRWDKNFLKLIRLLLERRSAFALFGGIRFGGTVTADEAFARGFDHIALAAGAGRPTVLKMPNGLARGVRTASDFLMALQLTGAARTDSIANMQLRLPVVVIGGGLTAIDAATEAMAYYPVQVEKFLSRYERLVAERGEEVVRSRWNAEELSIADEFLAHARALRSEREAAAGENREPRIRELIRQWGGVTIAYRKRLVDSPSYTLNHEEVHKALEEGIVFSERLSPLEIMVDENCYTAAIRLSVQELDEDGKWQATGVEKTFPARAVLVAAGTQPNTVLAREDATHFHLDGRYFQAVDEDGNPVRPERSKKPNSVQVLVEKQADGRAISFFGDLHPSFAGNVVGAMGSAKLGYPVVSRVLAARAPSGDDDGRFLATLNGEWRASVARIERLTPNIVEVVIRAPGAARSFRPGQFYRLQNFESLCRRAEGTTLAMEGVALTGAWVDRDEGLVGLIVLEMGGSSDLCTMLQPGERVILMGPTGMPTEVGEGETVLLAGGGLGNAVLFSIGAAMRASGNCVLYFAGYKKVVDRYKVAEIEAAADVVVWCCDEEPGFTPTRPQDRTFVGNIVECIRTYAEGGLGEREIALNEVDRIIAIGSDRMMAAVGQARHGVLEPYLKADHCAIGSINSPMQCMMKEVCAQCLQPHVDPRTGESTYVFSCFNQDQPLDVVDFHALSERLRQNSVQEKLTAQWIDHCLVSLGARPGPM